MSLDHETYMRRALRIARCGAPYAHPNPMVGAVIVAPDGKVLAEGFHRRCGDGHAEVNAVDMLLARYPGIDCHDLTIYVSLEPCAHYGRTPPCALLLSRMGFGRCVVGTVDPFAKVNSRGIAMMREAGIDVTVGVLQEECRALNRRFFLAHTLRRPWVTLKWAQSADGYMDRRRGADESPAKFSTPLTSALMHRLRTEHDAIAVGANTVCLDRPSLTARLWPGPQPRPVVFGPEGCAKDAPLADRDPIYLQGPVPEALSRLYDMGITSLLVEGGPGLLRQFIDAGIHDEIRVETAPFSLGLEGAAPAPAVPPAGPSKIETIDQRVITTYTYS